MTDDDRKIVNATAQSKDPGSCALWIFAKKRDVHAVNSAKLAELKGTARKFRGSYGCWCFFFPLICVFVSVGCETGGNLKAAQKIGRNCPAELDLTLKPGARVLVRA